MATDNSKAVSADVNAIFDALEAWINQRPGLEFANYGDVRPYRAELRSIARDKKRAMAALDEARGIQPARPALLLDAFGAYSGRLEWNGSELDYTAGQYWPTEYRKAAASVLERYISSCKQAEAEENPPTFTYRTMEDVIAANQSIGNHWFDKGTMAFFKCRIESGAVACDYDETGKARKARFITSEKRDDEPRRYTIREAQPDGTIKTVGEFQAYSTREQARKNLLAQ